MRALAVAGAAVFFAVPGLSSALPSYARDSKVSCLSCHYKNSAGYAAPEDIIRKDQEALSFSPKDKVRAGVKFYSDPAKPGGAAKFATQRPTAMEIRPESPKPMAGLSGYLGMELFQASVGWINPAAGSPSPLAGGPDLRGEVWYRLAVTPSALGLDFSLGLFGSGSRKASTQDDDSGQRSGGGLDMPFPFRSSSMGVDAGVGGELGGVRLDFKTSYYSGQGPNNTGGPKPPYAGGPGVFAAKAQVGINGDFGLTASYSSSKPSDGNPDKSASIGAWLKIKDGIKIMPEYTIYGPDGDLTGKGSAEFQLRFFTGF
jgi:hypothetical protein